MSAATLVAACSAIALTLASGLVRRDAGRRRDPDRRVPKLGLANQIVALGVAVGIGRLMVATGT